jgi:hypothetical protein
MIKNTIIKIAALFLAGASLFTSCKKEDKGSGESCTNNGHSKFLKVGNKLVYQYDELFSEDTMMILEAIGTTSGGATEFNITGGGAFGGAQKKRFMKECNDWLLITTTGEPKSSDSRTYKLVRTAGDTWDAAVISHYTVLEKDVTVTTPAGNFVCDKILYTQDGAFNTDTLYYSNEVGTVKYIGFIAEYQLKSKNF